MGGWGGEIKERCGRVGRDRGKMVYSRRIGHTTVSTMHTHTHTLHKTHSRRIGHTTVSTMHTHTHAS